MNIAIELIIMQYIITFVFKFDEYVIVSSGDNSIAIVKVDENDKEVKVIDEAHEDDVNCVDCDKNNGYVVSCSDDSSIKVWKIKY